MSNPIEEVPFGGGSLAGHVSEHFWFWYYLVKFLARVIRKLGLRKPELPPLSEGELEELADALNLKNVEHEGEGVIFRGRHLTGIQAKEVLKERGFIGRTVELPMTKLISTSSFGRSVMALVYKPVLSDEPKTGLAVFRFQCFTLDRKSREALLETPWRGLLRVRGRIVGCGEGIGGDPIRLSRCEIEPVTAFSLREPSAA